MLTTCVEDQKARPAHVSNEGILSQHDRTRYQLYNGIDTNEVQLGGDDISLPKAPEVHFVWGVIAFTTLKHSTF